MKVIGNGVNRHSQVQVVDEPGAGGACHEYVISRADLRALQTYPLGEFGRIEFQNGPVAENGVNGCHQEDLLEIVIHRLEGFQSGEYACVENGVALAYVREAMRQLNMRTAERQDRGVEGTSDV